VPDVALHAGLLVIKTTTSRPPLKRPVIHAVNHVAATLRKFLGTAAEGFASNKIQSGLKGNCVLIKGNQEPNLKWRMY